jgi:hypothetical protein
MLPKKSKAGKTIDTHQNGAAGPKFIQPVVRIVQESSFVHCYLACGHMLTMQKDNLKESLLPPLNAGRV